MNKLSVIAGIAAVVGLTACKSDNKDIATPAAKLHETVGVGGATDQTYEYYNQADYFLPTTVRVKVTGDVTFQQRSDPAIKHNVTFQAIAGAPTNIPNWVSGDSVRVFNTPGEFPYKCSRHYGMNGRIFVVQ